MCWDSVSCDLCYLQNSCILLIIAPDGCQMVGALIDRYAAEMAVRDFDWEGSLLPLVVAIVVVNGYINSSGGGGGGGGSSSASNGSSSMRAVRFGYLLVRPAVVAVTVSLIKSDPRETVLSVPPSCASLQGRTLWPHPSLQSAPPDDVSLAAMML